MLVDLILDESKWLTASMAVACLAVALLVSRRRAVPVDADRFVLGCMTLFAATTIGAMAFGHLLAVTTKLVLGTLEGSVATFYLIGAVLAVPSGVLLRHTRAVVTPGVEHGRKTLLFNGWLSGSLLALGLHNFPLALPALFNIAYHLSPRRDLRWAVVGVAIVTTATLFVGSLVFLASGQSFEDFSGTR